MSQDTDRLKTMAKVAPDQVSAIEDSISTVETSIEDLTKEKDSIENGVCGISTTDAVDIIENTILVDKLGDYVSYGSNFGAINWDPSGNLTDWEIIQNITPTPPPILPPVPTVIYTYTPGDYPELDQLVEDFDFGNDYLTRPLTDGASYGLNDSISSLESAKDLLNENADKVADSQAVFNRYAT
jgi:prefoldin subunit 5